TRDTHRAAARCSANPGPHTAFHQPDRVDDLHLPHPLDKRQTLARRADGPALVRRRHGRGHQPVPPRQRPPPPHETPRRAGTPLPRNCHTRTPESDQDRGLTITGPPPRFHGTRDIVSGGGPSLCWRSTVLTHELRDIDP